MIASFINETNPLKKVFKRTDLLSILEQSRANESFKISNLDLSSMDECRNLDFDGFTLENIIFSRFSPESSSKKELFNLSFMGACLKGVSFAQAHLLQCNFDTMDEKAILMHREKNNNCTPIEDDGKKRVTQLKEVDFFFCDLNFCRFRNTSLNTVDFRYSHVKDCTLSECKVTIGDFYFCSFQGCTNFIGSKFYNCSFTCSTFENNCIRMSNIPEGVIQEHSEIYHRDLIHANNWMKYNPCASFSSMNHEANKQDITPQSEVNIALEATDFYKEMSGIFTGKGLNRDSNEAYRKSKKCELLYLQKERKLPKNERTISNGMLIRRLFKVRLTQAFGYGYRWEAPTIWFILIVAFYGLIGLFHNSVGKFPFIESVKTFCYSLYNSMSPYDKFLDKVNLPWASFESVAGVLLIGFLGFIIANNIRNDS